MKSTADFSADQKYRWALKRTWDETSPTVMFVLLNPSIADATRDDPTIRRCIGFARAWGYGSLVVGNLFAFRATNPSRLREVRDPIGAENDRWLVRLARGATLIVAGWGEHGKLFARDAAVRALLPSLHVIHTTKAGRPRHPLYLKKTLEPRAWTG